MAEKLRGDSSQHGDIQVGVFKDGTFIPYGSNKKIKASIDKGADREARHQALEGMAVHGSFKDGNFRPADTTTKPGYLHSLTTHHGVYTFDYEGRLLDPRTGAEIGKVNEDGEIRYSSRRGGLDYRLNSIIAIAGLGAGIFFLSSNITGNAIAELSTNTTSWVGGVLLAVGLVAGFFWIKSRKKNPVVKKKK
jgi:hypothetical protein